MKRPISVYITDFLPEYPNMGGIIILDVCRLTKDRPLRAEAHALKIL